jgi:hypothetical protein
MMRKPKPIELSFKDREDLLERLKQSNFPEKDREIFTGLVEFNLWLQHSLEEKKISINKLEKMFGHSSEKRDKKKRQESSRKEDTGDGDDDSAPNDNSDSENSSKNDGAEGAVAESESTEDQTTNVRQYVPNTGRLGHEVYSNADVIVLNAPCKPGDLCSEPHCTGHLKLVSPGNVIKVVGQSFAKANKYVLQTLRCNLCDKYGFVE